MRSAHITNRVLSAAADKVSADQGYCPDGLDESAIDALIAEVDRELTAATAVAEIRTRHAFTDPQHAHRTRRRVSRAALRVLPIRLDTAETAQSGEAA
ncbi:hypothetical protein AB0M80_12895 [Amycolatopsis sp. NPDC051045]|uniref:hypothetical protein n=1 Tax=Amycolatopsis sp. NPDC051045 TaxID=3156922 RepID=UPI00343495BB